MSFHRYIRIRRPMPGQKFGRKKEFYDLDVFTRKAVTGPDLPVYTPVHTFADFGLDPTLQANITAHGYREPTAVQDQAIPVLLQGRDLIGVASTGSGKTGAFLLPLVEKVCRDRSCKILIVAPTRELAVQINDELGQLSRGLGIYSEVCIGGTSIRDQLHGLSRFPAFVIGTPGRLKDLESRHGLSFSLFSTIVLDEIDRMLDMGFLPDVSYLVSRLPDKRQSLGFSATLPSDIRALLDRFMHQPVTITINTGSSVANINQDVIRTHGRPKSQVLHDLLSRDGFDKVLVFGRTKHGIDRLSRDLSARGFQVGVIHGDKNQSQRQQALKKFRQNRLRVLLATDIASRGLDIDDVTHVINYDLPESYEDYVHRIGRTARAGKSGTALTFI